MVGIEGSTILPSDESRLIQVASAVDGARFVNLFLSRILED